MKLCTNCFYCDKTEKCELLDPHSWRCTQLINDDPLTGDKYFSLCHTERSRLNSDFVPCGIEGKLFVDRKEREREINADQFREPLRPLNIRPDDCYEFPESNDE
jgi:hypothetical protein